MGNKFDWERHNYLQSLTKEHAYKAFEDGVISAAEYLNLQRHQVDINTKTRALAAYRPKGRLIIDVLADAHRKSGFEITPPKHIQNKAKERNLQDKSLDILGFINSIRESDMYIKIIYSNGGCYQFYLLLESLYGGCEPLINEDQNHVVAKHKGKLYDITGEVTEGRYNSMTVEQLKMCENWSFSKHRSLVVGRCSHCDEPIIV